MRLSRVAAVLAPLLGSLVAVRLAAADGTCAQAVACCEAVMDANHQPRASCANLASAPPAACAQAATSMQAALAAQHKPVPATCSAAGGGGGSASGAGSAGSAGSASGSGAGSGSAADQAPRPLPAEDERPAESPDHLYQCSIDRVTGKRVVLTGDNEELAVRCVGFGAPGVRGTPPQRTAEGGVVTIQWTSSTQVGTIAQQLFDRATYNAPARVTGSANETILHARVTVTGPGAKREVIDAQRTMHVVNKKLRLTVTGEVVTHCTPTAGGSVTAGFHVTCKQTVDLEVGRDFTISSSDPKSCTPQWTDLKGCLPGAQVAPPQARWSIESATGSIDPDSAVMDLHVTGERVGYPDITWPGGKVDRSHTNALFPRPFTMSPDDNVMRSFGSLTTNASAGGVTTFELDAR